MAAIPSTGSPKMSRKSTPNLKLRTERLEDGGTQRAAINNANSKSSTTIPLQTSNFSNLQPTMGTAKMSQEQGSAASGSTIGMSDILARLRINDSRKSSQPQTKQDASEHERLDQLLNNLTDQNKTLRQQEKDLKSDSQQPSSRTASQSSTSDSSTHGPTQSRNVVKTDLTEVQRIKQELEAARSLISRQEQELAESRSLKHTMDQAMGSGSEADFSLHSGGRLASTIGLQQTFNASARPFTSQHWPIDNDARHNQNVVNPDLARKRGAGHSRLPAPTHAFANNNYAAMYGSQLSPADMSFISDRTFSSSSNNSYGMDERMFGGRSQYPGARRGSLPMRSNSTLSDPLSPLGSFAPAIGLGPSGLIPIDAAAQFDIQPRNIPGQISPLSADFPAVNGQGFVHGIPIQGSIPNNQTYVTPLEPMNYRRLLDKTVSCDWKYIVDKIVCNNDQQASIFLQQKLKVGTAEQKFEIVESIVNQAYPLMINRFGNFLVQRCFEHGTPDQVVSIANAIHGNVISLSMDPFGCHVVQKAFDSVPEDHKADMVRELLRRIPDTVIHRYACHVWQKLFELRWSGEPPQIMVKVNEALQGMWHEVALGETGSLVVQNIFENCVEEEKRPAIEEVVANIDLIAHGQFGNWCIQHLCEHGSPPDKRRVVDHILTNAYNYSIDQFASKVVEKCLKISGSDFLDRYLGVITTARPDRPRIPLIDIAGDQYGNYLIQWILMNTHQHQREQVAVHIRKHMVSLRGSKFGSRVAMLCSNPAAATRPGPATTSLVNPYTAPTQQRNNWNRYR